MNNILQRLQAANATHLWLLAGLILAFVPHLTHLPVALILLIILLMAWRLGYELKAVPLPGRLVRWLLTLIVLIMTFETYHTLLGRQAGIGLLVVMLCLKLMEMKQERDVIVAIGLGYFVVITVFLFNQSIFMGIYMLLVVVLLTTALTTHNREHSRIPQRQNLQLACTMLLQAAPLMLLLFVLFPRIQGPLWSLPNDSLGGSTGLSDTMSPGNISRLSNNNAVAFRVQFKDHAPSPHLRYWRGPVFTNYDGKTWSSPSNVDYEQSGALMPSDSTPNNLTYRARGEPTNYTVTLEPSNQPWLFALDLPAQLPPGSDLSSDYEIVAHQPIQQLKRYSIQSYTHYLLDAEVMPSLTRYLQLPGKPSARIEALVKKWHDQTSNRREDIVDLALNHFREQPFYYTREPPLLFNDPVDEFLFDTQRGFCEHYASAFVYLMRASGIPARVVTGYQGGEFNPLSDYFIVRQSDAHAWSEVWLAGQGWIRIDPTAVIPPSRIEDPQDLARMNPDLAMIPLNWVSSLWQKMGYSWDNVNHFWNQWIINYNQHRQHDFLSRLMSWFGSGAIDWRGMVFFLASGILIVFSFIAVMLLKNQTEQKDPATIAYQRFCRKLARRGLVRGPAEGATDFSLRARTQYPDLAPAIATITALYQHLRYAANPPTDALTRLKSAIRQFHF